MRIGIAAWLDALGPSGARTRLRGLLRGLAEVVPGSDHVIVFRAVGSEPLPGPFDQVEVEIPPAPTWRRILAERRLGALCTAHRLDVLDLQAVPVPPRLETSVCLTVHDLRDLGPYRRRPRWLARRVLGRALRRSQAVVVPSAFVAAELRAAFSALPPVHVIAAPAPSALRPLEAPDGRAFVHVGHLEPRKNLAMLVRAYARACERHPDLPHLELLGRDAGSGPELRALAAANGVVDRLRFRDRCTDPEVAEAMANARAVLIPSDYEGFGLPALEGLALGRPVLAADTSALPQVLGSAGKLLPPDDVAAWAHALVDVANQPLAIDRTAIQRSRAFAAHELAQSWHRALVGAAAKPAG